MAFKSSDGWSNPGGSGSKKSSPKNSSGSNRRIWFFFAAAVAVGLIVIVAAVISSTGSGDDGGEYSAAQQHGEESGHIDPMDTGVAKALGCADHADREEESRQRGESSLSLNTDLSRRFGWLAEGVLCKVIQVSSFSEYAELSCSFVEPRSGQSAGNRVTTPGTKVTDRLGEPEYVIELDKLLQDRDIRFGEYFGKVVIGATGISSIELTGHDYFQVQTSAQEYFTIQPIDHTSGVFMDPFSFGVDDYQICAKSEVGDMLATIIN